MLLICGEIDLSVGLHLRVLAVPHALPDRLLRRAGVPGDPDRAALRASSSAGSTASSPSRCGCRRSSPPSAPAFILYGLVLTTSHAFPATDPGQRGGHREVDRRHPVRRVRLDPVRLGRHPGGDLPRRAHPDPVGPAHGRGGRQPARRRGRPASMWPGSSTATS